MSDNPPPLASVPTGTALCGRLAALDLQALPDLELLDALTASSRQLAYQQAQLWSIMAELATRSPVASVPEAVVWTAEQVFDAAVEEVRAELRLTGRGAAAELQRAVDVQALPDVADALAAGRIDRIRAVVLAEACTGLTPEQQATLLAQVLPGAGQRTWTGVAAHAKRVAMALDPSWAERRYHEAIRARRVIGYLTDDGSATISGHGLPADHAALALARVNALAKSAKRAGAHAPIDHLRAELFLGLLDGRFQHLDRAAIIQVLLRSFPKPATNEPESQSNTPPAAAPPKRSCARERPAAPPTADDPAAPSRAAPAAQPSPSPDVVTFAHEPAAPSRSAAAAEPSMSGQAVAAPESARPDRCRVWPGRPRDGPDQAA